jgi:hypothetical protein
MKTKTMKNIFLLLILLTTLISCEKNCDDEVDVIQSHYMELIENPNANAEQRMLLRREMNAKIREACN